MRVSVAGEVPSVRDDYLQVETFHAQVTLTNLKDLAGADAET